MNSLRNRPAVLTVAAVMLLLLGATVGYRLARHRGPQPSALPSRAAPAVPERSVLYWYDPMQPSQHFDKPGRSPFMEMQLIPKYADEQGSGTQNGVRIDPAMLQTLGIRFTTVQRGALTHTVDAVGSIGFNQRDIAVVQTRTDGFITRVYARAPSDVIERNAPLVDLQAPEWIGAQTEFIALLKSADRELIEAARQRMVLLGMPADLIAAVERRQKPQASVTVRSPISGVITTLDAREGMSITSGATIASINGIASVWLEAAIPEVRAGDVPVSRGVTVRVAAFPGENFSGHVVAILPQANSETRTLRVRIELPNPSGRLRPGMFADVSLGGKDSEAVVYVATEALIRTGKRTVVILAGEDSHFMPTEVETGPDIGGNTVIRRGLAEGQRVVASGQFLIDSEASLKGILARLDDTQDAPSGTAPEHHHD